MKFDKNQKALLREGILSTFARMAKKLRKPTDSVGDNINRLDGIAGGPQGKLPGGADRTWNDALPVHRKIKKLPAYKDPVGDKIDRLEGIAGGPQGKLPGRQKRTPRPDWVKKFPVVKEGKLRSAWKWITGNRGPGGELGDAIDTTTRNINTGLKANLPDVASANNLRPAVAGNVAKGGTAPRSKNPLRWREDKAGDIVLGKNPEITQQNLDLARQQLTPAQKAKILGFKTAGAAGTFTTGAGYKAWHDSQTAAKETAAVLAKAREGDDAREASAVRDAEIAAAAEIQAQEIAAAADSERARVEREGPARQAAIKDAAEKRVARQAVERQHKVQQLELQKKIDARRARRGDDN